MKLRSFDFIALSFFTVCVNLIILSLIYTLLGQIQGHEDWTNHTNEVRFELKDTLSALLNAETGQRGYLITGDERFLDPYNDAAPTIQSHIQRLSFLTSDLPDQQQHVQEVKKLAQQRLDLIQEGITIRKTQGFPAVVKFLESSKGRETMDELRGVISQMTQYQTGQYMIRLDTAEEDVQRLYLTLFVGFASNLLLIIPNLFLLLHQEFMPKQTRQAATFPKLTSKKK